MGKLFTLVLAGVGAVYWWRSRQVQRCPACTQEIRAEALICKHCGQVVQEGATIDVEAR